MKFIRNITTLVLTALVLTSSIGCYIWVNEAEYCMTLCEKDTDSETEKEIDEDDKLPHQEFALSVELRINSKRINRNHTHVYPSICTDVSTPPPEFI